MFEASHPFAFFDYFRVPYNMVSSENSNGQFTAPLNSLGQLRVIEPQGNAGRVLLWLRSDASRMVRTNGYRLGRYYLADCNLFGHMAHDIVVPDMLQGFGRGWYPAEPVLDVQHQPAAAIWRDSDGNVFLPFDPGEMMHYFWSEKYRDVGASTLSTSVHDILRRSYYLMRPALPRPFQVGLRRAFTRVQSQSTFPRWPIEENLHELYAWLFGTVSELVGRPVPFIDLWPDGRSWALVLTHDVETHIGYHQMSLLRNLERERGYKSSWNFVPLRYQVEDEVVRSLKEEGCEVGVHGLRHDGRDLGSKRLLEKRLPAMRAYAEKWDAVGFRSPGTQRHWELMPQLGFDYDSSYSDSDPYEPQPGGCCTYLPYFNGEMVELPITMAQDHTLFEILQHSDASAWLRKARLLRDRRAMVLILTHPDYANDSRIVDGYRKLLDESQGDTTVWHALPQEVATWWRKRSMSRISGYDSYSCIEGPAAAEGMVRFATAGGTYAELMRKACIGSSG
jgi:hypothetical protein